MINYKIADKSYISALVDMRLEYIREDDGYISEENQERMKDELPAYFEKHIGEDIIPFIAEEDGKVVSTAFLLIAAKPLSPRFINGKTGSVLNVYTRTSYRKKGIAMKLMQMLLEYARFEKLDYLELKSTKEGYSLYKKCGFIDDVNKYKNMQYRVLQG